MKKVYIILSLMFGLSVFLDAQTVVLNENMTQDGTNVMVSFDVDTDNTDLPHQRKEVILPYIYSGKDTLFLDVLEVYGKGRFKRERQEKALSGDKEWGLSDGMTLKNEGIYKYESLVPLKRWMQTATLGIRRQIVGCACEGDVTDENIAQASLFKEPTVQRRMPAFVIEDAEKLWDFGKDELEIAFKVSKIELDSSVFNNEVTFGKILSAIENIFTNPHYTLDRIEVAGYASPEGPSEFNAWLAENRAKALIDYIIDHSPEFELKEDDFVIVNGKENWSGLRKMLLESDLKQKDQVLAIIDNEKINDEYKKILIDAIDEGRVWRKMLKEMYPHLRSARYLAVYYDSTDDKTIDLINNANAMIREGKYAEAEQMMTGAEEDARGYNTMGVAIMMQGRFEEAMTWFKKAVENGNLKAQDNIDTLDAEFQWEAQQRRMIEEYLKKYE